MKLRLAFASVLVLSACGTSPESLQALQTMQILENNTAEGISYEKLSGSGNDVTLTGVSFMAPGAVMAAMAPPAALEDGAVAPPAAAPAGPVAVAKADTLKFNGLTMKDGKPVFRDLVVSGIAPAFPIPGSVITVGSIGFEGLNEATGKYIAGAFTKEGPGEAPAFNQWQVGKASLNGLSVKSEIPQEEGGAAGSANFTLGELSFSNLKDEKLGLARIGGIKGDFNVPTEMMPIAGTFDFGTFDMTNINTGMFAQAFEMGMASVTKPGEPIDYASVFAGYTSPLEAGLDGASWTGAAVNVSGVKFDATPASYKATRNADGVVVAVSAPRSSMKLSADSSGGGLGAMGLMMLAMSGYPSTSVELYSQGEATFDPAKDLTRWTSYNFGVSDMVDVKVEGGIQGLKQALPVVMSGLMTLLDAMEPAIASDDAADEATDESLDEAPEAAEGEEDAEGEPEAEGEDSDDVAEEADDPMSRAMSDPKVQGAMMSMGMGLISLQLTDLDLSITDKQLVGFILQQMASRSGQSVSAYRQDLVGMVSGSSVFMTDAGIDAALANEMTAAVAGFLREPGTLRIQIKPKTPVGAMTVMMAMPTKESLGFSATFVPAAAPN